MSTNWKNSFVDGLPSDKQEVLVSVEGINFVATYNSFEKGFHIKDSKRFIRINPDNSTVYWAEIPG